jgi:hypothetical protein
MHLPTLTAALLLPFLVMADSTTTSTSTMTKTITVLQVVATETMTYHNATSTYASVGTTSAYKPTADLAGTGTGASSSSSSPSIPANYMGAASSLSSRHVGGAALVAMAIAAML